MVTISALLTLLTTLSETTLRVDLLPNPILFSLAAPKSFFFSLQFYKSISLLFSIPTTPDNDHLDQRTLYREKILETCRGSPLSIRQVLDQHMPVKKLTKPGGESH